MVRRLKIILVLLTFIICTYSFSSVNIVHANSTKSYIGVVKEVIDGEAFRIKIFDKSLGNPIWYVRLVGIQTNASQEAFEFVNSVLLNTYVHFQLEQIDYSDDTTIEWKYGYINVPGVSINEELLSNGLAHLDYSHKQYSLFNELEEKYMYARENYIGLWENIDEYNPYDPKVNINTATYVDLEEILEDTDSTLANKITYYRVHNKYESLDELKVVSTDITNEWIDKNKNKIKLVTNINSAQRDELDTLIQSSEDDDIVQNIMDYRILNTFESVDKLKYVDGVADYMYDNIKDFVSIKYTNKVTFKPEIVLNINTASAEQLKELEYINSGLAELIVKRRVDNKYSFKTIEELQEAVNPSMNDTYINILEDNFNLVTNVNTASTTELESLFGLYDMEEEEVELFVDKIVTNRPYSNVSQLRNVLWVYYGDIKPHISVEEPVHVEKVNLNLASIAQLKNHLHITMETAEKIYKNRRTYTNYGLLPVDLSLYDDKIALYTNVNTATKKELMMLHEDMTEEVADEIIRRREVYKIGSLEEFEEILHDLYKISLCGSIDDFVVFR